MTPAGIEPATFRFVAQHLKHCATAVSTHVVYASNIINIRTVRDLQFVCPAVRWYFPDPQKEISFR